MTGNKPAIICTVSEKEGTGLFVSAATGFTGGASGTSVTGSAAGSAAGAAGTGVTELLCLLSKGMSGTDRKEQIKKKGERKRERRAVKEKPHETSSQAP